MPRLAKLYREMTGQDVVVLGVNDDETPEVAQQFMVENGYGWPSLFDRKTGSGRKRFKVESIPAMVVIDREGRIVAYEVGLSEGSDAAVRAALRQLGVTARP